MEKFNIRPMLSAKNTKAIPNSVFAELPETYVLSQEQRQFYEDNGYLVIKELIDFATLYGCKQRFIQLCKNVVKKDKTNISIFIESSLQEKGLKGEDLVNKIQDILYDEVFSTYTENPRLLHIVSQFIGDKLTGIHSMIINKPPGTGRHPPHQDLYYFLIRPIDKIIGAWTAIDHVRTDNGCLYVVPGSHKKNSLYSHAPKSDASKLYHGVSEEYEFAPVDRRVDLEMSPGDTVFLHPLVVHGSGPNVSKNYRKAISCHYANSECQYIEPSVVQQPLAKEIEDIIKKYGVEGATMADFFQFKSKAVKGPRCNL